MIKFVDKLDRTESTELPAPSNYKEIKPILKTFDNKVQRFWEDVFGEDNTSEDSCFTDEEIISEIFERNESDFKFDINIADKAIQQ